MLLEIDEAGAYILCILFIIMLIAIADKFTGENYGNK